MKRHILSLNCGSSSLKYALFEADEGAPRPLVRDEVEGVGDAVKDHEAAVHVALDELARSRLPAPDAIGHRVVHGGAKHVRAERIDDALVSSLRDLVPLAPVHLPPEIRAIEAARARFPDRVHVACFDTAFHRTMSAVAQRFALPSRLFDAGVVRYGFHGISYGYVIETLGALALVGALIAHLGSGASLCAVREGKSVDTTMGLTPTGGIVMSTRSGDLDPGLVVYLLAHGYDAASLDRLVNHESGLLALSGTTGDMKRLVDASGRDPAAKLAIDVFAWSARKAIGALATTLGGIDTLVFTAGIGARSAVVRRRVTEGLEHLGVEMGHAANEANAPVVSAPASRVAVRALVTDEEQMIARHAFRVLEG